MVFVYHFRNMRNKIAIKRSTERHEKGKTVAQWQLHAGRYRSHVSYSGVEKPDPPDCSGPDPAGMRMVEMKHKRLVIGAFVVVLVVLAASPAWAVLTGDWQMDETSGQMHDSSGFNNHGSPTDVVQTGSVYVFNGSTSRVAVPDSDSLDPVNKDITLVARVQVGGVSLDDDSYDIVRKGLSKTAGGDYKMEIKRTTDSTVGYLNCVFKGNTATVNRVVKIDIVDGNWHALQCTKTSTTVVATVDGKSYTKKGTAGSISNAKEVLVGAKTTSPFDDVFEGSMDFVSIDIAQ